jgi:hypothetical protein
MLTRRTIVTQALSAGALLAPEIRASESRAEKSKVVTRDRYDKYVSLYNAFDPAFADFYQDDVVMETVPPLKGRAAIVAFCRELRSYVIDTLNVEYYVADETGSASQLLGEFLCIRDIPSTALSGLFGRAVKKGQVKRQRGHILYGVKDEKFSFVRAAPPVVLQDWA